MRPDTLHPKKKMQYLMNISPMPPHPSIIFHLMCKLEDIIGSGQLEFIITEIFDILHMLLSSLQMLIYFGAQKIRDHERIKETFNIFSKYKLIG